MELEVTKVEKNCYILVWEQGTCPELSKFEANSDNHAILNPNINFTNGNIKPFIRFSLLRLPPSGVLHYYGAVSQRKNSACNFKLHTADARMRVSETGVETITTVKDAGRRES